MSNTEVFTRITYMITAFPITSRKMFGGIGVFSDGVMFALIYDGMLYLKSTSAIAKTYSEDSRPFQPPFHRNITMPYWSVPTNLLQNSQQFTDWTQQALNYARATKKKK